MNEIEKKLKRMNRIIIFSVMIIITLLIILYMIIL